MTALPLHDALLCSGAGDAPALTWASGSVTHDQLRESVLRVAARLRRAGVGPGARVAVCLPKCVEAVQLLLGTLAAGATQVPVDAFAPAARVAAVLADAEPQLVFTAGSRGTGLPAPAVVLPELGTGRGLDAWLGDVPYGEPAPVADGDPAAILYTSGTTGRPKGIVLSHRNISCFVSWAVDRFGLDASDRFLGHAPLHFDLSTLDLYAPLRVGGRVHLLDEKTALFPAAVAKILEEQATTVWYSVPTALRQLLAGGALERRDLSALRLVLFAGEAFAVPALRELMRALPHPVYANLYGPTETNVCTYHVLSEPPPEDLLALPIGVPCEHADVSVRDGEGRALGVGEVGEIHVGGPGVFSAYWRQPELTRASRAGAAHRTGDLGCWQDDGTLVLRGRLDQQVKVRGHRVELLEVESRLLAHPDVAEAAVVLTDAEGLAPGLVAFVTPRAGRPVGASSLRRYCAQWLPAPAVPSRFVVEERLPSTSTGKLDRRRLQRRAAAAPGGAR